MSIAGIGTVLDEPGSHWVRKTAWVGGTEASILYHTRLWGEGKTNSPCGSRCRALFHTRLGGKAKHIPLELSLYAELYHTRLWGAGKTIENCKSLRV